MNRYALYMPGREPDKPGACMRVRSVSAHGVAISTGKTEDALACLRGAVSGGAEKNQRITNIWMITILVFLGRNT